MPNVSPNASQWNIVCVGYAQVGFALGMYISCCLCQFHLLWVANAIAFLCGIWALLVDNTVTLCVIEYREGILISLLRFAK